MNIIVPMAGSNDLFDNKRSIFPKNLYEIKDKPLVQHVYENLKIITSSKFIFIIDSYEQNKFHTGDVLKLLSMNNQIVSVEKTTAGAACSVLLAIEHINNDEPLLITNGDQIILEDFNRIIDHFREKNLDGGIVVFDSIHPRWSYVLLDENSNVIETAEKNPISSFATAGFYYFKHGYDFVNSCMEMIKKEVTIDGNYYVSPTFNEMILKQKKIGVYEIDRAKYFTLSGNQDIVAYETFINKREKEHHD